MTILADQNTVRVDIEVEIADDRVDEEDETFMITGSVGGVATPGTVTFAIGDDDERGVTVTPLGSSDIVEQDTNYAYRFTVQLRTQPTGDVTIEITDANFARPPGFLFDSYSPPKFTPANWNMPQTVVVTFFPDDVDSPDGPWTITPTATGADYTGVPIASLSGMLIDNDDPRHQHDRGHFADRYSAGVEQPGRTTSISERRPAKQGRQLERGIS